MLSPLRRSDRVKASGYGLKLYCQNIHLNYNLFSFFANIPGHEERLKVNMNTNSITTQSVVHCLFKLSWAVHQ